VLRDEKIKTNET